MANTPHAGPERDLGDDIAAAIAACEGRLGFENGWDEDELADVESYFGVEWEYADAATRLRILEELVDDRAHHEALCAERLKHESVRTVEQQLDLLTMNAPRFRRYDRRRRATLCGGRAPRRARARARRTRSTRSTSGRTDDGGDEGGGEPAGAPSRLTTTGGAA